MADRVAAFGGAHRAEPRGGPGDRRAHRRELRRGRGGARVRARRHGDLRPVEEPARHADRATWRACESSSARGSWTSRASSTAGSSSRPPSSRARSRPRISCPPRPPTRAGTTASSAPDAGESGRPALRLAGGDRRHEQLRDLREGRRHRRHRHRRAGPRRRGRDRARQGVPQARGPARLGDASRPRTPPWPKPEARAEIDSEVARQKGGIAGACMVSDAFFPFRDGVDVGIREGVTAVVQPGGRTATSRASRPATRPAWPWCSPASDASSTEPVERTMPLVDMPLDELKTYTGRNPRPADQDAYWERALAEMPAVDPKVELVPHPSTRLTPSVSTCTSPACAERASTQSTCGPPGLGTSPRGAPLPRLLGEQR